MKTVLAWFGGITLVLVILAWAGIISTGQST